MNKNWTSYKGLMALSLPSIIATMLEPISSVIDTALVGKFDTGSLAALAIGTTLISSLTWMFNFLVHAPIQAVSDKIGKGLFEEVASLCKLNLLIALGLGLLLIGIIFPIRFEIYKFMGAESGILSLCDEYFSVRLFGQSFILLFTVVLALLRGFAKVNAALIFISISTSLNIIFSYLSLYVFDFGLKGVAWATVGSNGVGFIFSLLYLINIREIKGRIWCAPFAKSSVFEFGQKSLNIFGRSSVLTLSFFLSTKVAANIGLYDLAAHQIILQVWLFASFFTDGVATTGNIVSARIFKTKDQIYLKEITRKLIILGAWVGVVFTLVYIFASSLIFKSFTNDLQVIEKIKEVWPLIAFTQVPLAVAYVYDGIIFGLGRFEYLRKHMMVAFCLCFLPFAYYGYEKKVLIGVWAALACVGFYRLMTNFYLVRSELRTTNEY